MNCNTHIVKTSAKTFNKFISCIVEGLTKPKGKFVMHLLFGLLFTGDLILTNIASRVPYPSHIAAIAKRFRRHLADSCPYLKRLWLNYLSLMRRRVDIDRKKVA